MPIKRILVYGGKGGLGSVCVDTFKAQKWWVGNIDSKVNDVADVNIVVDSKSDLLEQEKSVVSQLQSSLGEDKVDAIICVAGGWAGGNAASKDFVKNCDLTYKQSSISSIIASSIAAKLLKDGGLLTFTGSAAALDPTPGMIGYGMFKASVHHLTKSLGAPNGGLPNESTVVALLPITLDTPMNRKFMPKADFASWTPLDYVSNLLVKWCNNESRPPTGSLVKLETENNQTETKIV